MAGSPSDPSILALVIAGLNNGLLWRVDSGPIWFGRGTSKPCLVRKRRIGDKEVQCDLPGPRGSGPAHVVCYRTWRAESDIRRKKNQRDGHSGGSTSEAQGLTE
jgi:hypothetical protein